MNSEPETLYFGAETTRLLDLVIHSLYMEKEIFLRELISNASDALDRLRFEALVDAGLIEPGHKFEIRIEIDKASRTLTVSDSGIGMSREEVIKNIGTIARSGTREARDKANGTASTGDARSLIGQFGVGFYSSFMVAEQVTIVTRRAGESGATRWESCGDGAYTIAETVRDQVGTSVTLLLRRPDAETGLDDFTDTWRISKVVRHHSDFINYPIILAGGCLEARKGNAAEPAGAAKETVMIEDRILNSMKPLWTRRSQEVTEPEYKECYKHISHDWNDPLLSYSFRAEGLHEYQVLLFVPEKAAYDTYYGSPNVGLQLYAKRVLVIEKCRDLLPSYLRFLKGVVDASDLPLNVSRQRLQYDRHVTQIRKWLTKKVLEEFEHLRTADPAKYLRVWREFGRAIKEGVSSDFDNKGRLTSLLLFESSNSPTELTSLRDYVARMPSGQTDIYYLTGQSRHSVENSPHLEALRDRQYEVLFLVDGVDELVVQHLTEFEGKRLKSAGKGVLDFDGESAHANTEGADKNGQEMELQERFAPFLESLQHRLSDVVKQVRLSKRLVASPGCLVVEDHDYSPYMEKLLQKGKGGGPRHRRILELNAHHEIVTGMNKRFEENPSDPVLDDAAVVLLGITLLAEGSEIAAPATFNAAAARMTQRMIAGADRGVGPVVCSDGALNLESQRSIRAPLAVPATPAAVVCS